MQISTRAIILKKIVYGEADLIVTFFGRQEGRISGIAKNAKTSQKRFGGALEIGSIVDLEYSRRLTSDIVVLDEVNIHIPTHNITRSLKRIAAMTSALELALAFLPEHEASPPKFDLLAGHIAELSQKDPIYAAVAAFELKWLSLVGYKPVLDNCLTCGIVDGNGKWYFSVSQGGIVCQKCLRPRGHNIDIDLATLARIKGLQRGAISEIGEPQTRFIREILTSYMQHILGRQLTSRMILNRW